MGVFPPAVSVLLLVLLVLAIVLFLPVRTHLRYEGEGSDHALIFRFGIFHERLGIGSKISLGKGERDKKDARWGLRGGSRLKLFARIKPLAFFKFPVGKDEWRELARLLAKMEDTLRFLLRHSRCRRLTCRTTVGYSDYALTGTAMGAFWAFSYIGLGWLGRMTDLEQARVEIDLQPIFGVRTFRCYLDCIFETSFGHIMIELIRMAIWWLNKS